MSLFMSAEDAAEWSEAIGQVNTGGWRQVVLAVKMGVPAELGLEPAEWAAKYMPELGRVPRKELPDAAKELTEAGLTQRETGAVLGVSPASVNRAVQPVSNETEPEPLTESPQVNGPPLWEVAEPVSNETEPARPIPQIERERPTAHDRELAEREAVMRERRQRLDAHAQRIAAALEVLARMAGYPVPDELATRLSVEQLNQLRRIIAALEGDDDGDQ